MQKSPPGLLTGEGLFLTAVSSPLRQKTDPSPQSTGGIPNPREHPRRQFRALLRYRDRQPRDHRSIHRHRIHISSSNFPPESSILCSHPTTSRDKFLWQMQQIVVFSSEHLSSDETEPVEEIPRRLRKSSYSSLAAALASTSRFCTSPGACS